MQKKQGKQMSPISSLRNSSISYILNPYNEMPYINFLNSFGYLGDCKAESVPPGENIRSENQSVTSFKIGYGIALFAIEKEGNTPKAILCWHIDEKTPARALVKEIGPEQIPVEESSVRCFEFDKTYDFYIIGGKESTIEDTEEEACLLTNIRRMIAEDFVNSTIKFELINPTAAHQTTFVSANLQLNGTLTLSFHNR